MLVRPHQILEGLRVAATQPGQQLVIEPIGLTHG
jgi:hypothetical protein